MDKSVLRIFSEKKHPQKRMNTGNFKVYVQKPAVFGGTNKVLNFLRIKNVSFVL